MNKNLPDLCRSLASLEVASRTEQRAKIVTINESTVIFIFISQLGSQHRVPTILGFRNPCMEYRGNPRVIRDCSNCAVPEQLFNAIHAVSMLYSASVGQSATDKTRFNLCFYSRPLLSITGRYSSSGVVLFRGNVTVWRVRNQSLFSFHDPLCGRMRRCFPCVSQRRQYANVSLATFIDKRRISRSQV